MSTLLEKIEANAALRLTLPPQAQPARELSRYKNFLKVETHRLKILHRAGEGGREICQARAEVIDLLQRYIVEAVLARVPVDPQPLHLALVALGGYGRGELNPHSDIDVMLLHDGDSVSIMRGKPHPILSTLTGPGGLIYTLNDIGLKVGHATRNIDDCVQSANANMQSKTSLIEARLIWGDEPLFKRMQALVRAKCVMGHEKEYIDSRLEDQAARRAKYGNSACMQEPNLKNGCGGLRDYQNLLWMAFFKYRIHSLKQLEQHQQLNPSERKQLETAYDFLLRVRNELHYQTNRAMDVLSKSLQPTVAYHLGYVDRSPVARIERFMRDLYRHTRTIYLLTRTLEQRLALRAPGPKALSSIRNLIRGRRFKPSAPVDGLQFTEGEIHAVNQRIFRDQPRRLMRVFFYLQQRGLPLNPELVQLIRQDLFLVDKTFLRDPHVHETFLEILNQRGNVAWVLRAMHEVGFLGKYLPEFGGLTCLVQHEFYHQYTADEHTLVCLEKLDQIWHAQAPPFNHYTEVFHQLERPYVLYLALLLHDAGKASHAARHAEEGAQLAQRAARRMHLDPAVSEALSRVIENHLLMAQTSQRHDLDDTAVIRGFVEKVKSPENLDLLMLHTFADSQGTSNQLWNDFKETLLWTLYRKARQSLTAGTDFLRAEARQREDLIAEIHRLVPHSLNDEELRAHLDQMPPRYFQIHSAREIVTDLTLVHRFMHLQISEEHHGLEPVVAWHNEPDRGYTSVKVCTWNRTGLFSKIAGSFSASGFNILSAQIFSRNDGIILDTFYVNDAHTGKLATRENRDHFETWLRQSLIEEVDFSALIARAKIIRPSYQSVGEGGQITTRVHFDNEKSDTRTIIEIETEDRVGLLYMISRVLTSLGLDISIAKISTEKGAAIDTFYVNEVSGAKIESVERQQQIATVLRIAITALD